MVLYFIKIKIATVFCDCDNIDTNSFCVLYLLCGQQNTAPISKWRSASLIRGYRYVVIDGEHI